MSNKLQELTDKLYNEGLSKGKEEGEALIAQANSKAESIIENAKEEAAAIIEKARKEAEEYKSNIASDVAMAASKSVQTLRHDIESLIVAKIIDAPTSEVLSAADFVKGMLQSVAEKFSTQESSDLSIVLPETLKSQLEPFVNNELAKAVGKGIEASFSKKINGGFTIGPKNGSYFISLTDETFKSLFGEYLTPATKKILFGE